MAHFQLFQDNMWPLTGRSLLDHIKSKSYLSGLFLCNHVAARLDSAGFRLSESEQVTQHQRALTPHQ